MMRILFEILRRKSRDSRPYRQFISYETEDEKETVATALTAINRAAVSKDPDAGCDTEGNKIAPVRWEAGCLQKKCGACAMVIGGTPRLACDAFLREFSSKKPLTLEPLSKFPVVADLLVDRSILFQNLKTLQVWSEEAIELKERQVADAYEASRCMQCGCCLEVCPNYCPEGTFAGAAGFVPAARLLTGMSDQECGRIRNAYREHVYNGCGKSLSCEKICPAKLDIRHLLSRSNAIALWRRHG